jgi:hypothetical protein
MEVRVLRLRFILSLLLCAIVFLLLSPALRGQATTSLGGHVTDASGAVIPGASLTLTSAATGATRSGTTGGDGEYQFSQLPPGRYTLDQALAAVEAFFAGIEIVENRYGDLSVLSLPAASVSQQVTVTSSVQPMLNTTDATLGNAFNRQQVSQLPLSARNVPDLLTLQPGVTFLGRPDDQQ